MKDHARGAARRLGGWLGLTVAIGALIPAGALAASTASLDPATNTVTIIGGPEDNNINTGGGLMGTLISDSAGIIAGPGCTQSSPTQVGCGRYTTINADLGAGNDSLGTLLGPGTMGVVHGGPGNDKLYGDDGNNRIYGDEGDDILVGNGGDDYIDGGPGHDQLFGDYNYLEPGSGGNDTINARDSMEDDIACGYGWDVVTADPSDRAGSECDQVIRTTSTPPPPAAMSIKLTVPARSRINDVVSGGFVYKCWFSTAGTVATSLWLPGSEARKLHLGRKDLRLDGVSGSVDAGWYKITLRVNKKYRAALRRARTVTVQVVAAAIGKTGNKVATASKTAKLVR